MPNTASKPSLRKTAPNTAGPNHAAHRRAMKLLFGGLAFVVLAIAFFTQPLYARLSHDHTVVAVFIAAGVGLLTAFYADRGHKILYLNGRYRTQVLAHWSNTVNRILVYGMGLSVAVTGITSFGMLFPDELWVEYALALTGPIQLADAILVFLLVRSAKLWEASQGDKTNNRPNPYKKKEKEHTQFVIQTAQGRAVVMDDVTGEELTEGFRKVAEKVVQDVRKRHGMDEDKAS
jgi:multisubunit Na+/H+ antiporter MnhB subunit